jgi:hypothetical protein
MRHATAALLCALLLSGCAGTSSPTAPGGPSAPSITSFTVDRTLVAPGTTFVMQWAVTGAAGASIDNGIGPVDPSGGRLTLVAPSRDTTYTLIAQNGNGTVSSSQSVRLDAVGTPEVEYRIETLPGGNAVLWEVKYLDGAGNWQDVNHNHWVYPFVTRLSSAFAAGQALSVSAYCEDVRVGVRATILRRGVVVGASEIRANGVISVSASF